MTRRMNIHPELHALTGLQFEKHADHAERVRAGVTMLHNCPGMAELASEADYARVAEAEVKLLDGTVQFVLDSLVDIANGFQTGNADKDRALAVAVCFDVFQHLGGMFTGMVESTQGQLCETMEEYLKHQPQAERDRVNAITKQLLKRLMSATLSRVFGGEDIGDLAALLRGRR